VPDVFSVSSEPNVETTFRLIFVLKYLSDVTNKLTDGMKKQKATSKKMD
jgi:hypothetical protein